MESASGICVRNFRGIRLYIQYFVIALVVDKGV